MITRDRFNAMRYGCALLIVLTLGACASTGQEGKSAKAKDKDLPDVDLVLTNNIGENGEPQDRVP